MATLVKWLFGSGAHLVTGEPVASGYAYFYVVGSEGAQEVTCYADKDENEALVQPIDLDAAGRAEVYIKAQAEIQIFNAADSLVLISYEGTGVHAGLVEGSWNGGTETLSTILTAIEANLGAAALYKESTATGCVQRTYHDVVRQFISPYDFDATGNGVADDTIPLQRAIDRAIALDLPVNLEVGSYKITSGLTATANLQMYGAGKTQSIILATATGLTGLAITGVAHLRDFSIQLPYAGDTYDIALSLSGQGTCNGSTVVRMAFTGGQGVVAAYSSNVSVIDCDIDFYCPNSSSYGCGINLGSGGLVVNCRIDGQEGESASYLTKGVLLGSGAYPTNVGGDAGNGLMLGGSISNCYVGKEGGLAKSTAFTTCTTCVLVNSDCSGAEGCSFASTCTAAFSIAAGAVSPANVGNLDGTTAGGGYDPSCHHESSSDQTPTFTIHSECASAVFRCTYAGAVTVTANVDSVNYWRPGQTLRLILQFSAAVTSVAELSGTGLNLLEAIPATAGPNVVSAPFMWASSGALTQLEAWSEHGEDLFT